MKVLWITVILVLSQYQTIAAQSCCEEYCFGKDTERVQTRQFTSKTAYQIAKGTKLEQYVTVPNCEPTKTWILSRHGTRLPSASTIEDVVSLEFLREQIVHNYKTLSRKPETGALCMEDLFQIQAWKFNASITVDKENYLTSQGWEDLKLLAKTYQRLYPNILSKDYNSQNYMFRHTGIQRTEESFKAFSEGLFGPNFYQNIHLTKPEGNDTLLRPYDYCPLWDQSYNKNDNSTEFNKFKHSALMNKTISDVSTRLGFLYSLAFKDIEVMWDMCRYEQAWNIDRNSAWCGAFTPAQLTVLEYYDDLRYYDKSGYGREINARLPCSVIKDMLYQLNSKTPPNAFAYFAHSTIIQTVITSLGMNKDKEAPTAANYLSMSDRRWKTSVIDPFASNLVAVKYECPTDTTDQEKVMFFLNQNPVDLDWCRVGLCDWSEVMKRYKHFYNADCSDYYCRSGATSITNISLLSLLITAILYLIY